MRTLFHQTIAVALASLILASGALAADTKAQHRVLFHVDQNDPAVMRAWGQQNHADAVTMLSDGNGDFARALGVEADMTKNGMGRRSRRYIGKADRQYNREQQ